MKTENTNSQPPAGGALSPFGTFAKDGGDITITKDGDTYALAWLYNEDETPIPNAKGDEIAHYLITAVNSHASHLRQLAALRAALEGFVYKCENTENEEVCGYFATGPGKDTYRNARAALASEDGT